MESSFDDTDSVGDQGDDGQLTIKIPNPKVYKARQSLWIGRRGKPRCDHCRLNNLKCDRVLPACNHCSWASGRVCKYTPLPTPAHRGIPRCDRCRAGNLKCDRNLPVCNFCAANDEGECNYTPKKRYRSGVEPAAPQKHKESLTSGDPTTLQSNIPELPRKPDRHTFYGQNIASSSRGNGKSTSPSLSDLEASSDPDIPLYIQTGRTTAERTNVPGSDFPDLHAIAPKSPHARPNTISFASHPFPPSQGLLLKSSTVEPWHDIDFVPLPRYIIQRLSLINSVEIPDRRLFDQALEEFMDGVMGELRETACLTPDGYSLISNAVKACNGSKLSKRLYAWVSFHHVCSGSEKRHLLIIPRDSIFGIGTVQAQRLRLEYCTYIDEQLQAKTINSSIPISDSVTCGIHNESYFERVPVQPQIYDVLTYAHRSHDSPLVMVAEVKQLGFANITWPMAEIYVRLCPLCTLRGKQEVPHSKQEVKSGMREIKFGR
ncbi:hypothetical protein AX15_005970 [Amanita polypyramis BW_CC]|nr:hypothetical protein AX15_005970 [Amanita polypyramis BW_CC]